MQHLYISADNHLDSRWLPKDVFQSRLSSKLREHAPKVVETENGSFWEWEGKVRGEAADGSSNGKLLQHFFPSSELAPGVLPPADPELLLKHMDMAKTYAGVFYGDTRKWGIEDPELRLAVYRAYNDFVLELSATSPDRLLVLPNLPTFAPEACAAELRRVLDKGARAVEFSVFDAAQPVYEDVWEPVWEMAAGTGTPICCHIGDRAGVTYPPNVRGSSFAHFSTTPFSIAKPIAQFLFCGALERHPTLHVSFAECRIGWLPFFISWMDRQVDRRPPDPTAPLSMLPSEYIKRNVTFTFEEDYVGARMLGYDWAFIKDSAIWGSDYPHEQGTWPDPSEAMDKMFDGIDGAVKHNVLFGRAAQIFRIQGSELKNTAA